ncbi:glycoside hydrolase family 3 protein, partial [Streptomyces sp. NPDC059744]
MHHRTSRRTLLTATAATVAAAATGAVSASGAAAASASSSASASATRRLKQFISRMSLEEKVGQLFVMRVYGHSATEPDQADIDANLAEIGVRTAAELIAKYHVGGIIYFAWAHNTRDPHQIADLSNG